MMTRMWMYYYVSVLSTHISQFIDHHITRTGYGDVRSKQHDAGMLLLFIDYDDEDVNACSLSPFLILLITISSSSMMIRDQAGRGAGPGKIEGGPPYPAFEL